MTASRGSVLAMEEFGDLVGPGSDWIGDVAIVALGSGLLIVLAVLVFAWLMLRRRGDVKELRAERDEARRQAESLQERVWQLEQRLDRRTDRELEHDAWDHRAGQLGLGGSGGTAGSHGTDGSRTAGPPAEDTGRR